MSTPPATQPEDHPHKQPRVRLWFLVATLVFAAIFAWMAWPRDKAVGPYELSRIDGKSRFWTTEWSHIQLVSKLGFPQRQLWQLDQFYRRHRKPNPAAYIFAPSPVQLCSISGLLNQCMEVSGTHYFVGVEIAGAIEFGHTNTLNGAQWVAAFEHAIETNGPVICYDWSKKQNFRDTLLLIREKPRVVKIVPRSKLVDYQKAGLVKEIPPTPGVGQTDKL